MPEPEYPDLWMRTAQLVDVSFPERTIELVVMPYESPTMVEYAGRLCSETICRGAFDGIERRANRVRVNRDHNLERTVGRAVALYPSRDEGLVAEIRIAKTELGEETLQLAADGCLDASAGFRPMDGGLEWDDRNAYRITKGWLGHIAMTPDPAYEGAKVLAVRTASRTAAAPSGTPNLDQVRGWRLADAVASDPLYR
jgi:HK97 family phage prohead protease